MHMCVSVCTLCYDKWAVPNLWLIMQAAGALNPFELVIAPGFRNEH